jgi:hypothetical protein
MKSIDPEKAVILSATRFCLASARCCSRFRSAGLIGGSSFGTGMSMRCSRWPIVLPLDAEPTTVCDLSRIDIVPPFSRARGAYGESLRRSDPAAFRARREQFAATAAAGDRYLTQPPRLLQFRPSFPPRSSMVRRDRRFGTCDGQSQPTARSHHRAGGRMWPTGVLR